MRSIGLSPIFCSVKCHQTELEKQDTDTVRWKCLPRIFCQTSGERILVDRTNVRLSSSVTLCIVAKRCVLEQQLLLTACRKTYMRNQLVPK